MRKRIVLKESKKENKKKEKREEEISSEIGIDISSNEAGSNKRRETEGGDRMHLNDLLS